MVRKGSRDAKDVDVQLTWKTSVSAYEKEGQSRYEIPCHFTGTINIGGQTFSLKMAPGQRNHSWGTRNWWVADWVWLGLHPSDGTDILPLLWAEVPRARAHPATSRKMVSLRKLLAWSTSLNSWITVCLASYSFAFSQEL